MPNKGDREHCDEEKTKRLQQDIRDATGISSGSSYWGDFGKYIDEQRKFGPRRSVVIGDDGSRIVREYWNEESQEWIEDDGSDEVSG